MSQFRLMIVEACLCLSIYLSEKNECKGEKKAIKDRLFLEKYKITRFLHEVQSLF
jgi:hypothetical protein